MKNCLEELIVSRFIEFIFHYEVCCVFFSYDRIINLRFFNLRYFNFIKVDFFSIRNATFDKIL